MEIKELTLENLVDSAVKAQAVIEETEAGLRVVKDEIKDRLTAMKITGTKVNNWYVARARRTLFPDVTLSQAEELGATTVKIDSNKLKALYDKGIKLPVKFTEYILIREAKEKES